MNDAASAPPERGMSEYCEEAAEGVVTTPAGLLIGRSEAMKQLLEQIRRVAPTEATVLIAGESGTGKEAVAQSVHALSPRRGGPFIPVNCGAIPETLIEAELLGHEKGSFTGADRQRQGYFERARGGTIFLDEITEMPLEMQVKLLRVIESRRFQRVGGIDTVEVDVRIIAATNRDIEKSVRDGQFREDLMYRLAVFPMRIPALRERGDDVQLIAAHFLDELNRRENSNKHFSRQFVKLLSSSPWHGNVRELKNVVNRAFILSDEVIDMPLPPRVGAAAATIREGRVEVALGTPLADVQRELIFATLRKYGDDKRRAAEVLGISLKTLYNRLESYQLTPRMSPSPVKGNGS